MKNKSTKLILALILSMTMLMGMCMTAMADPIPLPTTLGDYQVTWNNTPDLYWFDMDDSFNVIYCYSLNTMIYLDDGEIAWGGATDYPTTFSELSAGTYTCPCGCGCSFILTGAGGSAPVAPPAPASVQPPHIHSYTWDTLLAPTTEQDGIEALICSCGDVKATQPISAEGYALDVQTQVIDLAGSGAPVVVDLGRYNVLPRWFVKKLVSRPELNITLKITYDKKNYVLEVPKTATIEDESIEWYGPLKLMSMFPQK